ncbi:MAG: rod shape-determining protein MreC [Gammaproteobacteria bacterium]
MKTLFIRGPASAVGLIGLITVSLALMTADHRYKRVEPLRSALSFLVYPLQYLVNIPERVVVSIRETVLTHEALIEDNQDLREQNLMLKSHSQRFAALEAENMRLRELLESSMRVGDRVAVADVVRVDLEAPMSRVVLDKGSQEGVYRGQPVIDAEGIMGQVIHVNPVSCSALLITDSSHALAVQLNRSGLRAIAAGRGAGNDLELLHVPINADIKPGDLIVSSGLDGRFPAGYPVGKVANIALDPGEPFAKIKAVASAKLGEAREVLLVWPQQETLTKHTTSPRRVATR